MRLTQIEVKKVKVIRKLKRARMALSDVKTF